MFDVFHDGISLEIEDLKTRDSRENVHKFHVIDFVTLNIQHREIRESGDRLDVIRSREIVALEIECLGE